MCVHTQFLTPPPQTLTHSLSAQRRSSESAVERLEATVNDLRRSLLEKVEMNRDLGEKIERLEGGYKNKILESESSVGRAMELVNRVQVAAGRTLERERCANLAREQEQEDEVLELKRQGGMWRKSVEKVSKENERLKKFVREGERKWGGCSGEVEKMRSERDCVKEELVRYRIEVARYEEREKEVVNIREEMEALKQEVREKEENERSVQGEYSALKDEMDRVIEMYQGKVVRMEQVCAKKIEMEGEMRRRLQEEVREARSAIVSMHKGVKDRNDLLNVLEQRLGEVGGGEGEVGTGGGEEKREDVGTAFNLGRAMRNLEGGRSYPSENYGVNMVEKVEIEPVVRDRGEGQGSRRSRGLRGDNVFIEKSTDRRMKERMERREKQKEEVRTRGGLGWTIK